MSGKGSKRRQRRINTHDEEAEKKVEEIIEQTDDNKSTISTEENGEKESKDKPEVIENGQKDLPTIEIIPPTPEVEATNGLSPPVVETAQKSIEEDVEAPATDAEDPELQFPVETNSDENSPILNRCKTRRSQTRSVPTPKTPKPVDLNGDEDSSNRSVTNEVRVNIARLQSDSESVTEVESSENVSVVSFDTSVESALTDKILESDLTNASVFVNLGDDTPRNMDFDEQTLNASNFIEITKDKTYGETLRCLTGRKTLRSQLYHSNFDLNSKRDAIDGLNKYSRKRKIVVDRPEEQKRAKIEECNPGFFSYIASPFKSRIGRTEITSSTPELTSFKFVHQSTLIEDVKKEPINLDEKQNVDSKKWCAIM